MYTQNSNRAWKRNLAKMNTCNRASRRNAARILSLITPTVATEETGTVTRVYNRPYVVVGADGFRVLVRSEKKPEGYASVMGPFKTTRAARYIFANPGCTSVREAERLAASEVTEIEA